MEPPADGGGRLTKFPGGRGAPIYTDSGRKLGKIDWLVLDPLSGRIVLVMISAGVLGLFARKQFALPWGALCVDPTTQQIFVRTDRTPEDPAGGRFAPIMRLDPARET